MSLQARLYGLIVIAVGVIALLAAIGVHLAVESSSELKQVVEDRMLPAVALGKVNGTLGEIHGRMMGVVLDVYPYAGSRHKLEEDRAALQVHWQRFWSSFDRHRIDYSEQERQVLEAVNQRMPVFWQFLDRVDEAYLSVDVAALARYYNDDWARIHSDIVKPIRQLVPVLEERATEGYARSQQRMAARIWQMIVVAAVAVASILLVLPWVAWRIGRGMRSIRQGLENLANNRFDQPLPCSGGDELAIMASALNTTAKLLDQDRREILKLKRRNELLLESVGVGIYGTNLDGIITFVNPACATLTGWSATELIGKPSHANLHHTRRDGSHYPREECPLYSSFNNGLPFRSDEDLFWRRDGSSFAVAVTSTPVLEEGQVMGAVVVFEDVSERRQAQERLQQSFADLKRLNQQLEAAQNQLLQSEKMASIGQLAAGVAHEINNPVGFVNSNLGTMRKYTEQMLALIVAYQTGEGLITDPDLLTTIRELKAALDIEFLQEDLPDLIRESEDGLLRVKKIVQDLKDFSHVNESEWLFADLNAGLDSTLNVVWNEVKYKANVVKEYGELPPVECLASQMNQVFMNMIVNAVQSLDERKGMGTLTLSTGQQGDEVWVQVRDTGKGMSAEVKRRIFEPFFTTKPVGKGTGLGLSLSFSIIQKHSGRIECESIPGEGTTFRIWVPIKRVRQEAA